MKKKRENKYPEEQFAHWLAMYKIHQNDWTKESIEDQISLYKSIEGDEEFERLKEEIKGIIQNDDLSIFVGKSDDFRLSDLELMTSTMLASE